MDPESDFVRNFKLPPFVPPENAETLKDIQYSSHGHVRQRLDLYLPRDGTLGDSLLPLIVYIHGRAGPLSFQSFSIFALSLNLVCRWCI